MTPSNAPRRLITLTAAVIFILGGAMLSAQPISLPQVSPAAEISQTIGITRVSVNYSRPSVNGRVIWGGVVPFGFADLGWAEASRSPWRAGANRNTVIDFQHDVRIEGKPVAAGQYGLHLAIEESGEALLILSHNSSSWGSYFYDPREDALRVAVRSEEAQHQEQLSYEFSDISKNNATLAVRWEKKRIPFRITVETDALVVDALKAQMRDSHGFYYQNLLDAANYLLAHEIELELALEWSDIAIDRPLVGRRNAETLELKARILEKLGRRAEARAIREELAGFET